MFHSINMPPATATLFTILIPEGARPQRICSVFWSPSLLLEHIIHARKTKPLSLSAPFPVTIVPINSLSNGMDTIARVLRSGDVHTGRSMLLLVTGIR